MGTQYRSFKTLGLFKSIKTYSQKEKMHKYSKDVTIFNVQHRKGA